jgi:hypothetical protein
MAELAPILRGLVEQRAQRGDMRPFIYKQTSTELSDATKFWEEVKELAKGMPALGKRDASGLAKERMDQHMRRLPDTFHPGLTKLKSRAVNGRSNFFIEQVIPKKLLSKESLDRLDRLR